MLDINFSCVNWNPRGLNDVKRRDVVCELVQSTPCHIVCLQETKLQLVDDFTASHLGGHRLKKFAQRPAIGTKGGILLLWDENVVQVTNVVIATYSISATVALVESGISFKLTTVYGPTRNNLKAEFYSEIVAAKPSPGTKWLLTGDFNQIYKANDKNRGNVNRRRIVRFRNALNSCDLKPIHLQNRKFTWSNGQQEPTMSKLDGYFCNEEWDIAFSDHILHALSSSLSDHCPLLLANGRGPKRPRSFRFENFWIQMPGFKDVVSKAWNGHHNHLEPCHLLFHKLKKTGQELRRWSKTLFSKTKVELHMALEVILRFDIAQESRSLSLEEREIRARLKRRIIGLVALERSRKRQCSRITKLKEGDANTKYFHLHVNARRRKNFIHRLKHNNGWVTAHDQKRDIIHDHFKGIIKRGLPRTVNFNWNTIPRPVCDLANLGMPFTEEEVKSAVDKTACDKAPGPDGFTGAFFKACWDIVKIDVMAVVNQFSTLHVGNLHWLNSANIALIPKKDGAEEVADFRPISLIHAIAKLISKMMATRLAPHMHKLVSNAQSAFIKTRSIHDNFLYVKNLARKLHKTKKATLLLKLDIKKAFDSVRWDYLMELLQHLGFPSTFRDWVSALLSTSSSRVLLNGIAGAPIKHGRGLRQGDPLSPLLFVLAIDPLHHILRKATEQGHLHEIGGRAPTIRTSLYVDDAAIFVAPKKEDIDFLASTLDQFGMVTGLVTNCNKSQVAPIRCDGLDLDAILQSFPASRTTFPMKYLGLPLSVTRLKRVHFQPLEDRVAGKLRPWEGKNTTMAGRAVLVKSVLTSVIIYFITVLDVPLESLLKIDSIRRAYLWAACEKVTGGKCKVNWEHVCKPKDLGGLGILNLKKFATALRLRWLWFEWDEEPKPWVGLGNPCNQNDANIFAASTKVEVGSGDKASFWHSSWLDGRRPKDWAPLIFGLSKTKVFSVHKGLENDFWVSQINTQDGLTVEHISQFVNLWRALHDVQLDPATPDRITWKFTKSGKYSSSSAYNMQFLGHTNSMMPSLVWKPWAPPKCKIFSWLILQNRVWTADRLERRGWQNCGQCKLCNHAQETAAHLFFKCRYTKRIWSSLRDWIGLHDLDPSTWDFLQSVKEWWNNVIHKKGANRKALASLAMLVSWEIWLERNARVFQNKAITATMLLQKIKNEVVLWSTAGAKALCNVMPRE